MKTTFILATVVSFILITTLMSSCTKDHDSAPTAVIKTDVKLAVDATLGNILTDSTGKTLYSFSLDVNGQSACTGACLIKWPVFYKANPSLGTGLKASDFGEITRSDNTKQTTYKGWPLYYFQGDLAAGNTNGDKVGNTWFVSKPDYTVMLANAQLIGKDGIAYNSLYVPATAVTQYITDDHGRTLYQFTKDHLNTNTFTLNDPTHDAVWPIDQVSAILRVPSILNKADFGLITVFNQSQLTYRGWPLYYYGSDEGVRGSNKGVSVPTPGVWPILNLDTKAAQ